MGMIFNAIYLFHPAQSAADIARYVTLSSSNESSRALILHSVSNSARETAVAFSRAITATDFGSHIVDIIPGSALAVAEESRERIVIIFTEQEMIYPLALELTGILRGEGVPMFIAPENGEKKGPLPGPGEGIQIVSSSFSAFWRTKRNPAPKK
jgi:hypothetical protein